jgi:hypothetical protein
VLFKPVPIIGPTQIEASLAVPAKHHNYAVAGKMLNAFAVGAIGAEDDFWLVALEPPAEGEGPYRPILYANLLDAFGRRLVTLTRNEATWNPRGCAVAQDGERLVVSGPDGREVLRVTTTWVRANGCYVSYFRCRLKDRQGVVRAESRGQADQPTLMVYGKAGYGIRPNATFAQNDGLGEEEVRRVMALAGLGPVA